MNINQKELNIKKLIKDFSIETTPNVYEKYDGLKEFLSYKNDVYVTYLPDENPKRIINTSKKIMDEGLNPVPHLPARSMKNYSMLEKYIGELSEEAGCKKILLIGGGNQIGNIQSTLNVLESEFLSKYKFKYVGVAGHPEGNPNISKEDLDKDMCFNSLLEELSELPTLEVGLEEELECLAEEEAEHNINYI